MRYLIILFLFLSCINASSLKHNDILDLNNGFIINHDTLFIDIKGKMTHALKYHDKYYVLFKEIVIHNYGGYDKRWLYIFSEGKFEQKVDLPKELEVTYLDFFVYKDKIILKPYMDENIYFLDTQSHIWKKINKVDDLIFEDEKYWIYSLDFGEWGGKTWFKDKVTGLEYVTEVTTPLVNKVDTSYYLTNSFQILKIKNPLLLNKCEDNITYEKIETSNKYYEWYGKQIGVQVIYSDTTFNEFGFSYKPSIVSSFVLKNQLLHLYETDTAIYISKIDNDSIKLFQKIADNLHFYNMHYSYRCRNLNGNNELLKFETKDERYTGLIDIIDNKISILYFSNKTELYPKPSGNSKANNIFIQRLNLILTDLHNLELKKVEQEEKKWDSYENTPNHNIGIGDSWNPQKYTIDAFKSFLIQEDSLISYSTEYFATKKNDLVRTVIFEWNETDGLKFQYEKSVKETFIKKISFLEDCIKQKAGNSIQFKNEKNYTETTWKTPNGLTIELESMKDFNRIRLIIFQNKTD